MSVERGPTIRGRCYTRESLARTVNAQAVGVRTQHIMQPVIKADSETLSRAEWRQKWLN